MTHNKDVTSRQIIVDHTRPEKDIYAYAANKRLSNIKSNVVTTDLSETKYFARRQPYLHFHYLIIMQFLCKNTLIAYSSTRRYYVMLESLDTLTNNTLKRSSRKILCCITKLYITIHVSRAESFKSLKRR